MIGPHNRTASTSDAHALCDWHTTQLGPRQLGILSPLMHGQWWRGVCVVYLILLYNDLAE
jgi:hypothetical protein